MWCSVQGSTRQTWVNPNLPDSFPALFYVYYKLICCCPSTSSRRYASWYSAFPTALQQTEFQVKVEEVGEREVYGFFTCDEASARVEWAGFEEERGNVPRAHFTAKPFLTKNEFSLSWGMLFSKLDIQSSFCANNGFQIHFLRHQNKLFLWM